MGWTTMDNEAMIQARPPKLTQGWWFQQIFVIPQILIGKAKQLLLELIIAVVVLLLVVAVPVMAVRSTCILAAALLPTAIVGNRSCRGRIVPASD